ncbi:putative VQ motif-containing protein [Helianthus annuus]|uniref:Putative VQ n=1 Tax=Helianthus annuus TaxID=4232 RepID=A0A251SBN9_HELAN|nr:VQ motif-containing protein 10 [Helianthus annuus]KAF5766500.1 putative VQ motif-containing protein 1/10 [Helianthus annuus]KAJ0452869.1 putative VQ motif-containing protein [Helianthus annuus]KAJ0457903.1 putative VQ motif-containing protein [Helianthus annuus]KAJ0474785.1 putative VQ motif-containing protein [Helianthus annuus]KAJ0650339.1 putative VQ motif-containing protein [Helianthus annuus]
MSRSRRGDPVKVVIINTEYIETDATNFKSVVQHLTGKDSPNPALSLNGKLSLGGRNDGGGGAGAGDMSSPMLNKGMSFRDLDKLLLELPTMDEMYQFCVD